MRSKIKTPFIETDGCHRPANGGLKFHAECDRVGVRPITLAQEEETLLQSTKTGQEASIRNESGITGEMVGRSLRLANLPSRLPGVSKAKRPASHFSPAAFHV